MLTKAPTTSQAPAADSRPCWVQAMEQKYSAGVAHGFILHFNVQDYVMPGVSLRPYIGKLMASRAVIAFYNRAEGITFAAPSMEKAFRKLVGLEEPENDPLLAELAAAGLGGGSATPAGLPKAPAQALPLLEQLLRTSPERATQLLAEEDDPEPQQITHVAAVLIDFAETILPAADIAAMAPDDRTNLVTVARWARDTQIAGTGNPIFLVTENLTDLHPAIKAASSKWEAIELPLPDAVARLAFISWYLADSEDAGRLLPDLEIEPAALANMTAGLSLLHMEDIFLRAEQTGALTAALVKERKEDIIATEFNDVIAMMEPTYGWEGIGGLQHVKDFFDRSVIAPMREGRRNRVPMGALMTGPAGTGKSAVAQAVAKEAGINACELQLAKILGQYVGNSERNLEKALRAIVSLAPTLVFMDEIDQSISRSGGGDSGVSSRIFKRLLEFMSDTSHRGKVIFLGATNRPDLMDAALRRPGRFDKKIPFLVPSAEERAGIFGVMARRYDLQVSAEDIAPSVKETEGWTGAEIEAAVIKAWELVEDESLQPGKALFEATQRLSPSTSDIQFMTDLAIRECNDADLLPPTYRAMLKDRERLDRRIAANMPEEPKRRAGRREF